MKKIIFSILMIASSIASAFTATEIANCKTRVNAAYISECKESAWNGSGWNTGYDNDCQPSYNQALARCDAGKMWIYKSLWNEGTPYEAYRMNMIKLAPPNYVLRYTDKFEFSISATAGMPLLKQCYYNNQNLSWYGFISNDSNCNGHPNTAFVFDYTADSHTYRQYFFPHVVGFSYPDTAATAPVYSCKGTHLNAVSIFAPQILKTYYFLSFENNCNGKTPLGIILGYGKNLAP